MAIRNYQEIVDGLVAEVKESGQIGRFSKDTFNEMTTALLNEIDHQVEIWSMSVDKETGESKPVKKVEEPVKAIRRGIYNILLDFGVDKQAAESILTDYQIDRQIDFYGFHAEALYGYLRAGRRFTLPSREDFTGSITLNKREGQTKTYPIPNQKGETGERKSVTIKTDDHYSLVTKSGAPDWLKTRL